MGDCSININPNVDELVEITMQTANTVKQLGMTPRIGLLSYSTLGSAKGESVSKVREAAIRLSRMPLDYKVEGEMQFDCCVAPEVAAPKAPGTPRSPETSTRSSSRTSMPETSVTRSLPAWADGKPLDRSWQGLNAPINDLSRGCNADEVYKYVDRDRRTEIHECLDQKKSAVQRLRLFFVDQEAGKAYAGDEGREPHVDKS